MNLKLGTYLMAFLVLALILAAESTWAQRPVCGDNVCAAVERYTCPTDCVPPPGDCNNDGVCNAGENCGSCADCPEKSDGRIRDRFCCGFDTCDTGKCGASCGAAVPECGNFIVEYNEECDDGPSGSATCDIFCKRIEPTATVPLNQFNIGDSIGEGEAANGTIGSAHHELVWSTGYQAGDIVDSLNERFEARDAAGYIENNASRDPAINQAVSGAVMADFANQAGAVAASMGSIDPGGADMVTILLGNNDVCAGSLAEMTDPAVFEQQYRDGLDVLAASPFTQSVNLLVSGLPPIYWLWDAKRNSLWCRLLAWPFVPCENLLDGPRDDCESSDSAQDPDNIRPGDGPNCQRRKQFHAKIRDVYNPILRDVLSEYQADELPNAEYVDIYDIRFESRHVNGGDCFHPSTEGHALMSTQQWCRSTWGEGDPACSP